MIEVPAFAAILALVVAAGVGGVIGFGLAGALVGSSEADDFLEARHDGYRAGYRAAAAVDQEHESFSEDAP